MAPPFPTDLLSLGAPSFPIYMGREGLFGPTLKTEEAIRRGLRRSEKHGHAPLLRH